MTTKTRPILIAVDGLTSGGLERQVVELLKGLARKRRFRTVLAILARGGDLEREAVQYADTLLPLGRRWRFDPTPAVALARHAAAENVGLIHAFGLTSGVAGLIAARWIGVPIINGSIRNAPTARGALTLRQRAMRWCACRSDAIVANSRAGLEAFGLAEDPRATVILNGVDLDRFRDVVPATGEGPAICMVAHFSRRKDHASLIRALPLIHRRFPTTRLVLVGHDTGGGDDLGTIQSCRALVEDLRLTASVRFETRTNRPEPFIAGSDVCVLASDEGEGISNAILEYMALSKPVVAADVGGNATVVQHGRTGLLVPRASPGAIAQCVIELLDAPDWARRLGEAGRRRVAEAFSLERMIREYEKIYEHFATA